MSREEYLADTRQAAGLTQAEAARRLGVSLNAYRAWEVEGRTMKPETARRLAVVFGVSLPEVAWSQGYLDDVHVNMLRQGASRAALPAR